MSDGLKHPKLETVYNIKDLDIGKCIPAEVYSAGGGFPTLLNLGNAKAPLETSPNNRLIPDAHKDLKSFFFIMVGYDSNGNRVLLSDRILTGYSVMSALFNSELYNYAPAYFLDMEFASIVNTSHETASIGTFLSSEPYNDNYDLIQTFNKTNNNSFHAKTSKRDFWVGIKYNFPIKLNGYCLNIMKDYYHSAPDDLYIQVSNSSDGDDWVTLDRYYKNKNQNIGYNNKKTDKHYNSIYRYFKNDNAYLRYRIYCPYSDEYARLKGFSFYKKREFESDINKYNFYMDMPSLEEYKFLIDWDFNGILKNPKTDNIFNNNSEYTIINQLNDYTSHNILYYSDTNSYCDVYSLYGYRPKLTIVSKKEKDNFIKDYFISKSIINPNIDNNVTIKLKLNENYEFPVDIRVRINNKFLDKYNNTYSNPNITTIIDKEDLPNQENFITIFVITKETKYHRSFNYKISIDGILSINTNKIDFIYNQIYKGEGFKNENNEGLTNTSNKAFKTIEVNTKNKSSIDNIELTKEDNNTNIKLKLKDTTVVDKTTINVFTNENKKEFSKIYLKFDKGGE